MKLSNRICTQSCRTTQALLSTRRTKLLAAHQRAHDPETTVNGHDQRPQPLQNVEEVVRRGDCRQCFDHYGQHKADNHRGGLEGISRHYFLDRLEKGVLGMFPVKDGDAGLGEPAI